ncbi:hypothetical protein M0R45_005868 [Rubus argutus]|uniref:DRBM domain-containing protein n=1 Tax=Rubus argutus TaxID=59490 RepID=A0AAW1YP04_RUBAR
MFEVRTDYQNSGEAGLCGEAFRWISGRFENEECKSSSYFPMKLFSNSRRDTINGLAFNTVESFKSSKQAQNDTARLALDHFSTSQLISNSIPKLSFDIQHVYKQQLLHYAQKKNLILPVYSCEWKGPLHANRFRCMVTIDGRTFQGQDFLPTMKDVEHAAAKVACISLLPIEQDDSSLCKNFLCKLLQTEGFHAPVYNTRISGEPHMPSFLSSVEIQEESFTGQEARRKNMA